MKERIIGVYCIENIVNGKKYVGQSRNVKDRWRRHTGELKRGKHNNSYLQESWIAYGESAFKFYVLEECLPEQLDEREQYYIDTLDTMCYGNGYNLTTGGMKGSTTSEEIRKKISKAITKSYTEELREIRRQDTLDYWSNPENKKRILGENNVMYGKHHSEESKRKMSEAKKGKPAWIKYSSPVYCKELGRTFNNASEASQITKISRDGIVKVCKGERYTSGGYHWNFC